MDKALRWAFNGEMPAVVLAPFLDKPVRRRTPRTSS